MLRSSALIGQNPPDLSTATAEFIKRRERHPQLYDHFAALLDETENHADALHTGDQPEDAIVKRIRHIGQRALTYWAEERHATVQPVTTGELRPTGKKNRWQTTPGWVELTEQLGCSRTQTPRPFCQADRIRNRGSSRRLERAMTDFGADESFASAAEKV